MDFIDSHDLDPVVPFSHEPGNPGRTIANIRAIRERCGIRRFQICSPGRTCRITGCYPRSVFEQVGRDLKQIIDTLTPEGFMVGWMHTVTFKIGENPFGHIRGINGNEASACPLDPVFREWTMENLRTVLTQAKPGMLTLEDDYQLSNHPGVYEDGSWGCFCDRHLKEFAKYAGQEYSLDELREIFAKNDHRSYEMQKLYSKMCGDTLTDFAASIEKTVHEISPETRIGLLECGCSERDGVTPETGTVIQTLGGEHRPFARYFGAFYGPDLPLSFPNAVFHQLYAAQHYPKAIESYQELDSCPFETFFASAARMESFASCAMFYGFDQLLFSCVTALLDDTLDVEDAYCNLYRDNAERLKIIRSIGKRSKIIGGVQIPHRPDAIFTHPYKGPRDPHGFDRPWLRILARYGSPYTTEEMPVKMVSGTSVLGSMTDDEITRLLSGSVALDGEAAEYLVNRGFGELLGITLSEPGKIDFWKEKMSDEFPEWSELNGLEVMSFAYAPFGLEGTARNLRMQPAASAKTVSWFTRPGDNKPVRAAITLYKNRLGGKVSVTAAWLDDIQSPCVFSRNKRMIYRRVFEWLGAGFPIQVLDRKNLFVICADDGEYGYAMFINLLADTFDSVECAVGEKWQSSTLSLLDGAEWKTLPQEKTEQGVRLRTTFAMFKPVLIRFHKKA